MAASIECKMCLKLLCLFYIVQAQTPKRITEKDIASYRHRVHAMFDHAYSGYLNYAYPYDELKPLTCEGHDTWGSFSLTLIDALDTLAVMGNYTEFRRVATLLTQKADFDIDINVSVFETNIRVVGGLLSAHLMTKRAGMQLEPGWPCSGPLLRLAETVAWKLLPAFDTPTGMPYGTVNLRYGVPKGETTVTCTAGVGTFIIEFGTLSRLTGENVFEKAASRALQYLWTAKSNLNLVGNHIDVSSGKWTAIDSGIGGGIDSYFEYLVKGSIMFQNTELLEMFNVYREALDKHTKRDDWYMWANMKKGGITLPMFTSLDAYWPGILSMLGETDKAMKTLHNFHQVWRQFGFTPEYYNIPNAEAHKGREGYPLRPELIESTVYLYQATKDPYLLEIGIDILESIEHSTRTKCGYATVKDVNNHNLDNRMESFFLAETTKYLYLLFDPDNFIHNTGGHGEVIQTPHGECVIDSGGYIFNTEAHMIDVSAVHCCSSKKKQEDQELQDFHDNLDIATLLGIMDSEEKPKIGKPWKREKKKVVNIENESDTIAVELELNKNGQVMKRVLRDNDIENVSDDNAKEFSSEKESDLNGNMQKIKNTTDIKNVDNNNSNLLNTTDNSDSRLVESQPSEDKASEKEITVPEPMIVRKTDPKTKRAYTLVLGPLMDYFLKPTDSDVKEPEPIIRTKPNWSNLMKNLYNVNISYTTKPELMLCPRQPFYMRMSKMGEMFDEDR